MLFASSRTQSRSAFSSSGLKSSIVPQTRPEARWNGLFVFAVVRRKKGLIHGEGAWKIWAYYRELARLNNVDAQLELLAE